MDPRVASARYTAELASNISEFTPEGNTALHIAMMFLGRDVPGATTVCSLCPLEFLTHRNNKGQIPLHLAAIEGNLSAVELLISKAVTEQGGDEALRKMMRMTDLKGNTALHLALRESNEKIASKLIDLDGQVLSNLVTVEGESPLALAVHKRLSGIVNRLLQFGPSNYGGIGGKNALHIAARQGDLVSASELLQKMPWIDKEADKDGSVPLHYAVFWEEAEMVRFLLKHDPSCGYHKNKHGNTPIHFAAIVGNREIFVDLLNHCPDSVFSVNEYGGNVLHLALHGTRGTPVAQFIAYHGELRRLINYQDENGNTPLHTAVLEGMCNLILYMFLESPEADPWITNKDGDTAIDLFCAMKRRSLLGPDAANIFQKLFSSTWGKKHRKIGILINENIDFGRATISEKYAANVSLVATIMATITFAAAFAMPGGYLQDGDDEGKVVLSRNVALKVFLISDTISMCCSLLVAYLFSSAKILEGPSSFYWSYAIFVGWLMQISFLGTLIAFASGMYAVLAPNCKWLGILICITCAITPFLSCAFDNFSGFILQDLLKFYLDFDLWRERRRKEESRRSADETNP